ncbi:MAG: multiprotein-bridging factor 1 family protein [Elusimicrobiota bacterium]
MKRKRASISLDEVFAEAEKDPKWAAAYARAGVEIQIAIQIVQLREKAGLTQGQLAKAVGTTQSVISRIEMADQNLTLGTLSKIALALRSDLVVQFSAQTNDRASATAAKRRASIEPRKQLAILRAAPVMHRIRAGARDARHRRGRMVD